jgi:hypothetical protein
VKNVSKKLKTSIIVGVVTTMLLAIGVIALAEGVDPPSGGIVLPFSLQAVDPPSGD